VSRRPSRYLIALGSNQRHHAHGRPRAVVRAALAALECEGLRVESVSAVMASRPLGPSQRTYANAAAVIGTELEPDELLVRLKAFERAFGRRRGQRWSARVLDLDIILWEGGSWSSPRLTVPHVAFRKRSFVLDPAAAIAPDWRDPLSGLTLRQLAGRRYTL
jgi:2-amino-4-hydroxy-6-hydroxymethyldihydropteridine diphosphokinase